MHADPGIGRGDQLRPKGADIVKRSRSSGASPYQRGSGDPGNFCVFNAQICILLHSRDSFLSFLMACMILKTDQKSTLCCTSINFRYFNLTTPFTN